MARTKAPVTSSSPAVKTVTPVSTSKTTSQEVDGLLSGKKWDATTISYSFPNDPDDYVGRYGSGEPSKGFSFFKAGAEQNAFKAVFSNIAAVTPLSFVEYKDDDAVNATIRIAKSNLNNTEAWAYYPSTNQEGGDAWFDNTSLANHTSVEIGSYNYTVFMHELGHSLGLKHSFEKGSFGVVPRDSLEYTVMSYSSYEGARDWYAAEFDFPQTLMMYDIAALQHMYGADLVGRAPIDPGYIPGPHADEVAWNSQYALYNPYDTTYIFGSPFDPNGNLDPNILYIQDKNGSTTFDKTFNPAGDNIFLTIWDNGGSDTFDLHFYDTGVEIDLRPGEWSLTSTSERADLGNGQTADGNIANALTYQGNTGSLIENAIGGMGNDVIIANQVANDLTGGAGNDTFVFNAISDSGITAQTWDVIYGFEGGGVAGGDAIDLSGIAGTFVFTGTNPFTATSANQLRYAPIDTDGNGTKDSTIIELDNDTNRDVDSAILLSGYTGPLFGGDFIV